MRRAACCVLLFAGACARAPVEERPPLVLFTVEGLRADAVGFLAPAPTQGSTPHLDRLASGAAFAGRAIAASSRRAPALTSLLTGLGPWRHGVLRSRDRLLDPPTLPQALAAQGYAVRAFRGATAVGPGSGLERGLGSWRKLRAGGEATAALSALAPGDFVWVHLALRTISSRQIREGREPAARTAGAARLPFGAGRPLSDPELATLRRLYREETSAMDRQLGVLLEAFQRSAAAPRAFLALAGVNGEALGEDDLVGEGRDLRRHSIETVLVLRTPETWSRPVVAGPQAWVSTTRLHSTLLEAAGVRAAAGVAPSLWQVSAEGILSELYQERWFNQFSWFDGDLQLLWTTPLRDRDRGPQQRRSARNVRSWNQLFWRTPPLSGAGSSAAPATRDPELTLRRWGPEGADLAEPAGDRSAAEIARRAARLRTEFLRFVGEERSIDEARGAGTATAAEPRTDGISSSRRAGDILRKVRKGPPGSIAQR